MAAAVLLLAVVILFLKGQGIQLFPVVLIVYTLISYYTDLWIYNRRQRGKAGRGGQGQAR
jgi:hypothetical protein